MKEPTLPIPTLTPQALAALLAGPSETQPRLLDVRTHAEHAIVALPHSLLVPLQELPDRIHEVKEQLGEKGKIVVYCHHGVRSMSGAALLLAQGLDAASLSGGIDRYAREVDPSLLLY